MDRLLKKTEYKRTVREIIEYIKSRYAPLSVIVYGSYADGSNNAGSDFDALVLTRTAKSFTMFPLWGIFSLTFSYTRFLTLITILTAPK